MYSILNLSAPAERDACDLSLNSWIHPTVDQTVSVLEIFHNIAALSLDFRNRSISVQSFVTFSAASGWL